MLKFAKINLLALLSIPVIYLAGCSSGEYDIEEHQVDYTEKIVKVDTIKKITVKEDDKIKEDKNNTKDSYTYIVQVGAFIVKSNFDRFYEQAKQTLGQEVYYEQTNSMYKIRVGSYTNRADAIKYMELAKSKGYYDAFVISKKK